MSQYGLGHPGVFPNIKFGAKIAAITADSNILFIVRFSPRLKKEFRSAKMESYFLLDYEFLSDSVSINLCIV
jgi:hypothetical protein